MVVYSKLAPSKKIPYNMTLKKQIGSNVFRIQPFNQYNVQLGYYYGKYRNSLNEMNYNGSKYYLSSPKSYGGGAGGSGRSEDVSERSLPPGHNRNPDGTLNSNPTSKIEDRAAIQRQAFQNKINQLKADVAALNFANVNEKDVENLFGVERATDFIYNYKLVENEMLTQGYLSKSGQIAKSNCERILATSDVWDNKIPGGFTVSYGQLFPNAGVDASWKTEFVDLGICFYELATNPFSPFDSYERQSLMALSNVYTYGNGATERDLQVGLKLLEGITGLDIIEMERHNNWAENKDYFYDLANGTGGTPSERKIAGEIYTKLEKGTLLTSEERLFAEDQLPWITTAATGANFATEEQKRAALTEIMQSKNYSPADKRALYNTLNASLTGEVIGYQIAMQEYNAAKRQEWKDTLGFDIYDTAKLGGGGANIGKDIEKPPSDYTTRRDANGNLIEMYKSTQKSGSFWDDPATLLPPAVNPLGDNKKVEVPELGKQFLENYYKLGTIFMPGANTSDVVDRANEWTRSFAGIEYNLETGEIIKSHPTQGDNWSVIATLLSTLGIGGSKPNTGIPSEVPTVIPTTKTTLFTSVVNLWDDIARMKNSGSQFLNTLYNGAKSLSGKAPETKNVIVQMDDGTIQIFKNTNGQISKVILESADAANDYIKANGLRISDFKIANASQVLDEAGNFKLGFQQTLEIPFEGGTYHVGTLGYRTFDKIASTAQNIATAHPTAAKLGGGLGALGIIGTIAKALFFGGIALNIGTEPGSQSAFGAFIGGDTLNQLTSYKLIPSDTVPLLSAMAAYNGYNKVLNDFVLPIKNFQDGIEKLPLLPDFYNTYMPGWSNAKHILDSQINVQAKSAAEYYFSVGLWVNRHSGDRDFSNSDIMLDGEFVSGKDYQEYLKAQEALSARINPYWSMEKIMEQRDSLGNPFNTTLFKADTYNHRYVKNDMFDTLYRAVEDEKSITRYDVARKTVDIKPELRAYIESGNLNKLLESGRADVRAAIIEAAKDGMITEEQKNEILKEINKSGEGGGGGGSATVEDKLKSIFPSITPVSGSTSGTDMTKATPQQIALQNELNTAKDINSVMDIAKKNGIDTQFIDTQKDLESVKNQVMLNKVGTDNEKAIWGIDRSKVYAPPVTDRPNYFTKVTQPETIKWDSKYVPQAATYGGQGAFNQQPNYDSAWSENLPTEASDRPWLNEGVDVFTWSNNYTPPTITQDRLDELTREEAQRIEDEMFNPNVNWNFAELVDTIEYNPIDSLKKEKK